MQMDAEVMSTEGHDALHAVEAARAVEAAVCGPKPAGE